MISYVNHNPHQNNEWIYRNDTDSAQNLVVTLHGGDGALSKSIWTQNDWTQYWAQGARGVSVQCFIGGVLQEVAQGGLGNPQKVANQKRWGYQERYKCGRTWYGKTKWCNRDVYVWGSQSAISQAGGGDIKSFALNLGPREVLKIVFAGQANITNTDFNGAVCLSIIPAISPSVIPESPEIP